MKFRFFIPLILMIFSACQQEIAKDNLESMRIDHVVIFDSDKLISPDNNVLQDSGGIQSTLDQFEESIIESLIIKSNDRFVIHLGNYAKDSKNNIELSLDLSKYSAGEKIKKLKEFKNELPDKIYEILKNNNPNDNKTNTDFVIH